MALGEAVNAKVPGGANVHLVTPADGGIAVRTYERGGLTRACGTGACASAAAARRWGWLVGDVVGVLMPGGAPRCAWRRATEAALGPGHLWGGRAGGVAVALIERSFREKIVLVGVTIPPESVEETENSLDELALLVDTAGADEVGRITQRRNAGPAHLSWARARRTSCASWPRRPTATPSCSTTS